jgi:type IV secretion system protein VirB4
MTIWGPAVVKLGRILKDYRASGATSALMPIHAALGDQMFLTKSGHLVMILSVRGADYECLDAAQLDQVARRFESSMRSLDEDIRLYQYLMKRNQPPIPHCTYEDPVAQEAISNRIAYLHRKSDSLYSMEIYFAIVFEGWKRPQTGTGTVERVRRPLKSFQEVLSNRLQVKAFDNELTRAREVFANKVASFVIQLPENVDAAVIDKQRAFQFLRGLVNYDPHKITGLPLKYDRFVDFQACDSALECHTNHLRLDDFYVQVLSLKEPPSQTFAHMLRGLQEIPCNYIIANEWKRESNLAMRKLIQSKRRHFHNAKSSLMNYLPTGAQTTAPKDMLIDDSAVAVVNDGYLL